MNDTEKKIMNLIVEANNEFIKLQQTHPSDMTDWNKSIHDIQKIICMRVVRRDYPNEFKTIKDNLTNV